MEENPVLVLFALRRHFKEREDQRGGLRGGQWGVSQRVGAEGMVEDRGGARQQEAHGVGQEGRRRGAVAVESTLDRLDSVFAMPPRAVEFFIHPLRSRRLEGGTTKRGLSPAAMPSALTITRQGWDQEAAAEENSSYTRLLAGGRSPWTWAWAVRCWESQRASCMMGAA